MKLSHLKKKTLCRYNRGKKLSTQNNMPEHIAIIMDGNRRWAKKRGLPSSVGHKKGADALVDLAKKANNAGLKYMTVYAFSTENWNRSAEEVDALMNLLREYLDSGLEKIKQDNVRIVFIGQRDMLAPDIVKKMQKIEFESENNSGMTLCIALSYGSRQEIATAAQKIAQLVKNGDISIKDIDVKLFSDMLYTALIPDPDMLIRTGGEQRISNYLLWQLAYTEFFFTDTFWPDFDYSEMEKIVAQYTQRERRYGKN